LVLPPEELFQYLLVVGPHRAGAIENRLPHAVELHLGHGVSPLQLGGLGESLM